MKTHLRRWRKADSLSKGTQSGLSPTFNNPDLYSPAPLLCDGLKSSLWGMLRRSRLRNSSKLAWPYISVLSVLMRLTCPSVPVSKAGGYEERCFDNEVNSGSSKVGESPDMLPGSNPPKRVAAPARHPQNLTTPTAPPVPPDHPQSPAIPPEPTAHTPQQPFAPAPSPVLLAATSPH